MMTLSPCHGDPSSGNGLLIEPRVQGPAEVVDRLSATFRQPVRTQLTGEDPRRALQHVLAARGLEMT